MLPETFAELVQKAPCFVINLNTRPDKWERVRTRAIQAGLRPTRWPAVLGSSLNHTDPIPYKKDEAPNALGCTNWQALGKGQIGCGLSHLAVLEHLLKNDVEYALCFEDDAVFCDNFLERAEKFYAETPKDCDVVWMGSDESPRRWPRGAEVAPCFCTHGLIYTKSGARKLIDYINVRGLFAIDINFKYAQAEGVIRYRTWIDAPNAEELKKHQLRTERSYGLVWQDLGLESDIGTEFAHNDLCRLMDLHGSDKGHKLWAHAYTHYYFPKFAPIRENEINLFELGLGSVNPDIPSNMTSTGTPCASVRAWRDFFRNGQIYGADIDKDILEPEDRIKKFYVDQMKPLSIRDMWAHDDLKNVQFDIIIVDGLHCVPADECFLRHSVHKLKDDGVFIIEDVHRLNLNYWQRFELPGYDIDTVHVDSAPNEDNYLVVVTRKK